MITDARRRHGRERQAGADPAPLFESVADCRDCRERGLERRRACDSNEPGAGVLVGSGAGGIDVAERQYSEFFRPTAGSA